MTGPDEEILVLLPNIGHNEIREIELSVNITPGFVNDSSYPTGFYRTVLIFDRSTKVTKKSLTRFRIIFKMCEDDTDFTCVDGRIIQEYVPASFRMPWSEFQQVKLIKLNLKLISFLVK